VVKIWHREAGVKPPDEERLNKRKTEKKSDKPSATDPLKRKNPIGGLKHF